MIELVDKVFIFIACSVLYIIDSDYGISVTPFILCLTFSSLNSYFDNRRIKMLFTAGYALLCQFAPEFLVFMPLVLYDVFAVNYQFIALLSIIPYVTHFASLSKPLWGLLPILAGLSYLLKFRTDKNKYLISQYKLLRDTSKERSILLEKKNSELMEKQDYEINMATLNERNRIAREIHDNVGHLLSRCLLQLGALMAINKEEQLKENLSSIKSTLTQAMDSIRSSVHDLHDESIDLQSQISTLVRNFTFCPVSLDYDISGAMDKKLKYCFITIVKEALSNVIKHSDATEVKIILREHPALYQLVIQDNGRVKSFDIDNGIGLNNISDRIRTFNGNTHINIENGFKIFISVPKSN